MKTNELVHTMQSFGSEEPGTSVVNRILQKLSLPVTVPATPSLPGAASGGMATGMKLLIGVGVIAAASSVWYLSSGSNPAVMVNNDISNEKPVVQEERQVVQPFIAEEPSIISGYVSLPDGTALADARVWVETVLDPYPNFWHQRANETKNAYEGRICRTDENGYFTFTEEDWPERFVVKAVPNGYPAGITEIIENDALPISGITITIDDSGGYIIGTLKNMDGDIITNATLNYEVDKPSKSGRSTKQEVIIPIKIEEDGSFTSAKIPPGKYNTYFYSKGYHCNERYVFIRKGQADIVDVAFEKRFFFDITGTVYDAETYLPLKDVEVLTKNINGTQVFEHVWLTDASGQFAARIFHFPPAPIFFQHPKYGFQSKSFSQKECTSGPVNVILSQAAPVRITVYKDDGTPLQGCKVKCEGDYIYYHTDAKGEVIIVCIPDIPVRFQVFELRDWRTITASELIAPKYGILNEIKIYMPPTGTLLIQVPPSVDTDTVGISCVGINNDGTITNTHTRSHFTVLSNKFILSHTISGSYKVIVKGNYLSYFTTNVTVYADETTCIVYKADTNKNGFISGVVRDSKGIIAPCRISLFSHTTLKKIDEEIIGDWGMNYGDVREFLFNNLNPEILYDISLKVSTTNIEVKSVSANGPPLEIKVPDMYRITGKIVTDTGEKIRCLIKVYNSQYYNFAGDQSGYENGEFFWYPLIQGKYYVEFFPGEIFAPLVREVTIVDSDVDIGDIVFDKGITLTGKIVDEQHQPISNIVIYVKAATQKSSDWHKSFGCYSTHNTGQDGTFRYNCVPKNYILLFSAMKRNSDYMLKKEIGPFSSDVDLGTLIMEKGQ